MIHGGSHIATTRAPRCRGQEGAEVVTVNENLPFALEKTNGRELIWMDAVVPEFDRVELVVGEAWVHNVETETMAIFHPPLWRHLAWAVRGMAETVLA